MGTPQTADQFFYRRPRHYNGQLYLHTRLGTPAMSMEAPPTENFFELKVSPHGSIGLQQTDLFNHTFKWLARHALLSLIILVSEFAFTAFSFYVAIHLVHKYPTP